jgi:cellulose synthase/poly-beta-1,6-N-acetylglucosamine synthase-like glycosyltransferase
MLWEIIFWICFVCLLHSYVFFPLLLDFLSRNKRQNTFAWLPGDEELPPVSILLAVYNEQKVIEQKILTTFNSSYPADKIEFLIGSDASTDETVAIIKRYQLQYPNIRLIEFNGRTGKSGIINELAELASHEIFIMTDANVFFREDTIYQLVKHYKNPRIVQVGGNILNKRVKRDGISVQEKKYLSRENRIKYEEGVLWGCMIGAFGGCNSIRKEYYSEVPRGFIVDDFYTTLYALEKGGMTINELEALGFEDVSNKLREEFRRKVRISIGNFQNLGRFKGLLWPPFSPLAFAFFSHKVLRWIGPFFILLMLVSSLLLAWSSLFFKALFIGQMILLLLPVLDALLKRRNIHVFLLRFISHFYLMNLALLVGFFKFIKGVESNIWKPTQRYQ